MSIFYQNRPERLQLFLSDNNTYTLHLHRQVELMVVLEGNLQLTVDHETFSLNAGDGSIIFPNQLHSLTTPHHSKILLCIFETDFCHSYRNCFRSKQPAVNTFCLEALTSHGRLAVTELLTLCEKMPSKKVPLPSDALAYAEGYLTLLLTSLFSEMPLKNKDKRDDLEMEQKLLLYLDAHFTEELSLDLLSRQFGISRFALSRLFTDKLHTTFPYYVNSKRLDYARDLLTSTELSVTQIALDAGFGSSRTFFREFNRAFHTTPGEYRKLRHPDT